MQNPTNGFKQMTKIIDLAKTRPLVAVILALILVGLYTGGVSFGASFLGGGTKISMAVAELKKDLEYTDTYLKSAVKQETKDRIREITQLKEDGKLLSEASIRLIIFQELRKSEDRIIDRLK